MWKLATIVLLLPLVTMAFEPPGPEMQRAAVGDLSALPPLLKRAFAPDSPDLRPIPDSGSHDWLAAHPEPGQTFDDFLSLRSIRPSPPSGSRAPRPLPKPWPSRLRRRPSLNWPPPPPNWRRRLPAKRRRAIPTMWSPTSPARHLSSTAGRVPP